MRANDDGALQIDSDFHVLLKVNSDLLPMRCTELLLRGYDVRQARFSLLRTRSELESTLPTLLVWIKLVHRLTELYLLTTQP